MRETGNLSEKLKNPGKPHGLSGGYAQEKPEFDGQPDGAPQGMDEPPELILKLVEDIVFFTSKLWHSGHLTVFVSPDEVLSTSKGFVQSVQTYS